MCHRVGIKFVHDLVSLGIVTCKTSSWWACRHSTLGGTINEVWYQRHPTNQTQRVGQGATMSWPTRPRDLGQEIHSLRNLIDKSCKIGK
jgi:hypothetical protein